jgi:Ca2+-binding EF-hand superfamily protein
MTIAVTASILVGAMMLLPGPALAETATANAPLEFRSNLLVDIKLENYIKRVRLSFAQQDADGDGRITQRDVDFVDQMQRVRMRALSLDTVMTCDLDGDGFVTESEARRTVTYLFRTVPEPQRQQMEIDRYVDGVIALDTDKDGKVSFLEARNLNSPYVAQMAGFADEAKRLRETLRLDAAASGELTLQRYEAAALAFFRAVDADNDGTISRQERDALPKQNDELPSGFYRHP